MLNKLLATVREYGMLRSGDTVVCAVSGGADSMALLFAMYLLQGKLGVRVCAAHFNHRLRGVESDRDEAFVRSFCDRYDIPLYVGGGDITAGKKGLEAAARDARYAFFDTLPGKIATAHTANDNAETVLMHLVRGTGLKGLGAIAPIRDRLIRPMLLVTREQVLEFLEEYHLDFMEDSSNETDAFLRNRLRHHVMPLLLRENPRLAENLSAMALGLREDEQALSQMENNANSLSVQRLRELPGARRSRVIGEFLKGCGVREPERNHIELTEALVFSENPSASAAFPGGVTVCRSYDRLVQAGPQRTVGPLFLPCPGVMELPALGFRVVCCPAEDLKNTEATFTVEPSGPILLRCRQTGDAMRLSGGTKTLKKLFIDRKIPARERSAIPVLVDETGVLGVYGIGVNRDRVAQKLPAVQIRFEPCDP
ncbi:MAG: tRNA lysidine(34) synthetase TilS [Oscillospiraceae bacterium]|nr:tRNA lysidine(34) synthetase TilS [Oscillospiraceae bacterium]